MVGYGGGSGGGGGGGFDVAVAGLVMFGVSTGVAGGGMLISLLVLMAVEVGVVLVASLLFGVDIGVVGGVLISLMVMVVAAAAGAVLCLASGWARCFSRSSGTHGNRDDVHDCPWRRGRPCCAFCPCWETSLRVFGFRSSYDGTRPIVRQAVCQ